MGLWALSRQRPRLSCRQRAVCGSLLLAPIVGYPLPVLQKAAYVVDSVLTFYLNFVLFSNVTELILIPSLNHTVDFWCGVISFLCWSLMLQGTLEVFCLKLSLFWALKSHPLLSCEFRDKNRDDFLQTTSTDQRNVTPRQK